MATQKWCVVNQASFCAIPNGPKLFDLFIGSQVETTGESQNVLMRGNDNKMHDMKWLKVTYKNSRGIQTGWVRETLFDDYMETFTKLEVDIPDAPADPADPFPYASPNPNDPAQYMVLGKTTRGEDIIKYNLCGEICVAFVMEVGIKKFLSDWKNSPNSLYQWTLGGISDKTTDASVLKNMLFPYGFGTDKGNVVNFTDSLNGPIFEGQNITPGRFQKFLETHYLIANVVINKSTGKLIADEPSKVNWTNHWVVLDKVSPNNTEYGRVEIYNPFTNRRQEYSYRSFISSFGGGTYTGLWIKRKQAKPVTLAEAGFKKWVVKAGEFADAPAGRKTLKVDRGAVVEFTGAKDQKNGIEWAQIKYKGTTAWAANSALEDFTDRFPDHEVVIQHPTPEEDDAAQYMFLPGENGIKNNMCGQLCAAFITCLDIETFMVEWKAKAAVYYKLAVAGNTDMGTGIDSIQSMFRVAPYSAEPGDLILFGPALIDPVTRRTIASAGKMQKMLETHYLIAGVRIKSTDKFTGRLSGGGTGHWVVVDKITTNGKNDGCQGWVEIYNPFPNKRQEYAFDEFMTSFAGQLGVWVKRKSLG